MQLVTRLDFLKLPVDVVNKMFNSLHLPIIMCEPEDWSIYKKDYYILREKDIIEKIHLYFCKQVLGINKQYLNAARRNELGRLPLRELTEITVIKF